MAISTKISHADLLAFPEDGMRREIVDGDLFVTPSPLANHQATLLNLAVALQKYLENHPIGMLYIAPLDVILSEFDVLEPDLLFVRNENLRIVKDWVRGAPDLVVEILSPTTAGRDRGVKLKAYARFGVREYWIVDLEERVVEVYQLTPDGYELGHRIAAGGTVTSPLLPDFSLSVSHLFPS